MEEQEQDVNRPVLPHNIERAVEDIRDVAFNTGNKELTFCQAYSIFLRSRQLAKEASVPSLDDVEKAKQIDHCWKQRRGY